ncbi:MAG: hypothetical protein ABI610_03115 [Acidobacteriota bacterium]
MRATGLRLLVLALLTTACGGSTAGLAPGSYPDPSVACPGGRPGWKLEVQDRRADRDSSEGVVALLTESIRRSFPGCRWDASAPPDSGRVLIEVHRFSTIPEGNSWEAAAEWTIVASDGAGRSLTEFEVREEVSRPNYRGSNNAKESLRLVFDLGIRRTLAGLRALTLASERLPARTSPAAGVAQTDGSGHPK